MNTLTSFLGIIVLLSIAYALSNNRKAIRIRTVLGALIIQISIGAFILYVPIGRDMLLVMSNAVSKVISFGNIGVEFLFGGLATDSAFKAFGNEGFIFAIRVLPIIVFFSALISLLYYIGIMQWIIKLIGGTLQKILATSKAESMSAAANIFVGQTEAPLVVKPYISKMTESELFAVMCGGLASISGSVMAGYMGLGVPLTYLIAASFMAAPAGLLFAKIMYPQTEQFSDVGENISLEKPSNILEAVANGASAGMNMALSIGAMLIAFIALIALINGMLGGIGAWFNMPDLTLGMILGWIFKPLAWVMGVSWNEAEIAGQMIGIKLTVNEFVGYSEFSAYLGNEPPVVLTEKTKAIITFALCGFANFGSIAVLIGGIGGLAPNRRSDIARLGIKAVIAGSLANLLSATIAGLFIGLGGVVLA
ncbi:NupC/NupG family nucleoside CNT transporter [Avibacterium paragallinarum]|uniref:Nucleoside permease n=3 Tax=Avibacterium paragallinarum TaxID=728 RepID=A0A0F5ER27_AVIPA|nr:NupC/NupG family nucleoside CNT transporter [Avibacterium paragallinarum]AZI14109.1 NupC/NupG family nucleoside CNT transporter [Avibacterium paragallinarum]MEE3609529.1 NupC/NupG family nucleoside CNT transporter [Avibacterium paragallinarum]MEE3621821.1 NupC/NupG family nucleoside CNT transporter [Avibacterium paragallinarum]MEE3669622.1 NupC/NupG family nucleoside CNT transporter [Avibacterium paragallinarum]MEE3681553.1 NupC/NupG family nucleoside CNT transporter [Avibacterium paragalli